jgi:hypothetical protein
MVLIKSMPQSQQFYNSKGRAYQQVSINVEKKIPVDITKHDVMEKLQDLRITPGLTNRTVDEKFPDQVFVGNDKSYVKPGPDLSNRLPLVSERAKRIALGTLLIAASTYFFYIR